MGFGPSSPPKVPPPPAPLQNAQIQIGQAQQTAAQKAAAMGNFGGTLLTGGMGVPGTPPTAQKTLLGM